MIAYPVEIAFSEKDARGQQITWLSNYPSIIQGEKAE
jgi:hypothetical protein